MLESRSLLRGNKIVIIESKPKLDVVLNQEEGSATSIDLFSIMTLGFFSSDTGTLSIKFMTGMKLR